MHGDDLKYNVQPTQLILKAAYSLQAESVAALVNARTAAAADSALAGLAGGLGAEVAAMRAETLAILAEMEVLLCIVASAHDQCNDGRGVTLILAADLCLIRLLHRLTWQEPVGTGKAGL